MSVALRIMAPGLPSLLGALVTALSIVGSAGCGAGKQAGTAPESRVPHQAPDARSAERATLLPALTPEERKLAALLRTHVSQLTQLGERTASNEWNLAAATDYIALQLEASGYEVSRQGFTSPSGKVAQNLEVQLPGSRLGHQWILLGARMDSRPGSPGADDGASGASALLALGQALAHSRAQRSLKLVFFSDAGDRTDAALSGAQKYAAQLPKNPTSSAPTAAEESEADSTPRHETRLMLELGGLGVFKTEPHSQRYPEYALSKTPTLGDFAAICGYVGDDDAALSAFAEELMAVASLKVQRWVLTRDERLVQGAPHREFRHLGIPSGVLFDTHSLRSTSFGTPSDTIETLDFERMARVVEGMRKALPVLLGPSAAAAD